MNAKVEDHCFAVFPLLAFSLFFVLFLQACEKAGDLSMNEPGSYISYNPADCLPDITLLDQNGMTVSVPSLKGKPVLIDFIYTRCPGPLRNDDSQDGTDSGRLEKEAWLRRLGSEVTMVSVTLDPEHDRSRQLLEFAKEQNANRRGWRFLTGNLDQIEQLLTPYHIRRIREANGTIDHVLEMFLLGPDGRQRRLYSATTVTPKTVAADNQPDACQRIARMNVATSRVHLIKHGVYRPTLPICVVAEMLSLRRRPRALSPRSTSDTIVFVMQSLKGSSIKGR
jgi:cytochrome oxidase Cu insertion factor (SCO1/SenC/PrrC family)